MDIIDWLMRYPPSKSEFRCGAEPGPKENDGTMRSDSTSCRSFDMFRYGIVKDLTFVGSHRLCRTATVKAPMMVGFMVILLLGARQSHSLDYSIEQVVDGLRKRETAFQQQRSVYIEYLNDRYSPIFDNGYREKYVSARKDGMYYLQFKQLTLGKTHKQFELPYWIVWKDNINVMRRDRAFTISAEPDFNLFDFNLYVNGLFLNYWKGFPVQNRILTTMYNAKSAEEAYAYLDLVAALTNPNRKWEVLPSAENLDGVPCVVLKNEGWDRIWLDPAHGFACRQRYIANWDGSPGQEYRMTELTKRAEGLWLPNKMEVVWYGSSDTRNPDEQGKVQRTESYTIEKVSFAELSDSFFDLPIPENAAVSDQIRGMEYAVKPSDASADDLLHRTWVLASRQLTDAYKPPWYVWLALALTLSSGLAVGIRELTMT
jgi:hypothetical protein